MIKRVSEFYMEAYRTMVFVLKLLSVRPDCS